MKNAREGFMISILLLVVFLVSLSLLGAVGQAVGDVSPRQKSRSWRGHKKGE